MQRTRQSIQFAPYRVHSLAATEYDANSLFIYLLLFNVFIGNVCKLD